MLALKAKVLSTEPLAHDEAKWTKLVKINYADETGTNRTWESAERTTRPASCGIDGVGIVAILRYPPQSASSPSSCPSSSSSLPSPPLSSASSSCSTTPPSGPPPRYGPRIVLQRQYRPPIDAICIEIPAGLVDEGETPS
ncbi:ADP-ribose pyrophosphatase [Microdochium nivale]|nr:ADP-ribose pyrophosphatase [Microdochium nivale]